jgi:hypothetical protein
MSRRLSLSLLFAASMGLLWSGPAKEATVTLEILGMG